MIWFLTGTLVGFALYWVGLHLDENFRHETLAQLERYLKKRNHTKGENA